LKQWVIKNSPSSKTGNHKNSRSYAEMCMGLAVLSNIDKIEKLFLLIIEIDARVKLCYYVLNWLSKHDTLFFYPFA